MIFYECEHWHDIGHSHGGKCKITGRRISHGVCAACDGSPLPLRGLGDVIARVAGPVARAIDHVAGTHLENCKGCAKRQSAFNAALPFSATGTPPPPKRITQKIKAVSQLTPNP